MDTIFVLNTNRQVIDILSNNGSNPSAPFFGDTYTSELDTGAESYEFTTINNARTNVTLEVGNYVLFKYNGKYKLFQIMETTDEHSEGKKLLTVYAEMAGMELRNDYCEPFTLEGNFINLLERILQDTNWRVGTYSESLLYNIQPISYTEPKNVYSIIQENLATFGGVEIEFRVEFIGNQLAALLIDCYESGTRGNKKYRRFEYGKDVKGITRERNINDLATAVIGQGNNNLTFKDVEWSKNLGNPCDKPLQQNFVVDINANDLWNNGGKYIKTVHKVDTDDAQTLLQECWDYLQEIKQPKFDYDVDLALVAEDYQDIGVGDTNYVLDFDYQPAILLEARVGKLELSFADPRDNKCTLTNYKELVSLLQQPVDINTVGNMIQNKFPIEGEDIAMGAIGEGHINVTYYQAIKTDIMSATLAEVHTLIADKADITELTALNAEIGNLKADKADITDLDAIYADIYNLKADKANINDLNAAKADILDLKANKADIEHLNAANARIDNLTANKADITDLNAANGNIANLTSQVGHIDTIINGHFTGTDAQVLNITAQNTTFDNAVIKDAMIDTVSANKMNTGTLNTNNVNIESEDGGIKISGATQQFKDKEGHVRVQIGKDAQGNFTFCLFSQDGKGILLDETGIKAGAVPDGLIVNNMVADNANISGDKIDISSVITNINNNTTSIKSSAIKFDDTGQTLQVAFNELKTKVNTIAEVTIDGDLSSVMEQVTTNTTNIGVMQGQISSLISNTSITKENGQVVQLKDDYSVTKQTVNEISAKMGSLETNYKKTLKTSSVQYYLSTSLTSLSGGSWQDTAPSWTQGKYMWQRMKYTYTDNSVTYGTASCVAGAKGDTGSQGPKGDKGEQGVQGIQGPQGEQGIQGIKGDTGAKGPQGEKGDKGDKGEKGDIGPQGVQGPAGKDGKTYYTWIKYADNSTGSGMSNDPTGKTYIGFAYNKTTSTESNTASDYTWSLIKGEKGDTGVQGPSGKNGTTTYTWIKYSDNADGTGLYDTPKSTTKYIGIATNKTTATESTTNTDYTWSLFKGDKGDKGAKGDKGPQGEQGIQGPQGSKGDTGEQGPKGDKGATGEKGQSLTSSTPQWYLSTSNTTQTGGSWQDTMPQVATGKYVWQRFKNVWTNPTATTYTTPVLEQIAESVKEVTSKQAEFKKTLDEVSSKLTETTTTANSALNKATTAQQNLDGFKTTVSNTYTTKTDFNKLSIGGRNLAQKTSSNYSSGYSNFTGVTNTCSRVGKVLTDGLAVGDTITVRLVYKYENIVAATGQTAKCWIQGAGNTTSWNSGTFYSSPKLTISGSGEHTFNYSFTIAADHLKNSYWSVDIRHDYVQSGTVKWKMFKVEKGNKATDWTPAPEDIENTYATKSEVKQTADGLTTEVSKKLNSADLSSRIQQSATDIKIGFNKITDFITIDPNDGLKINHEDGSYTRINAGGLELYQAYTGYRYKCLIATGSFSIKGRGTAVVTLPAQFDNVQDYEIEIFYTIETSFAGTSSMVDKTCICDMYANDLYHINFEKDSNGHWTRKVDYSLKDMCVVEGLNMHVGDFGDMSGYVHWIAFA